jgi:hypothetical protein
MKEKWQKCELLPTGVDFRGILCSFFFFCGTGI